MNTSYEYSTHQVRDTDLSVSAAKARYRLFTEGTMKANEELKRCFPYNLIHAQHGVEEVVREPLTPYPCPSLPTPAPHLTLPTSAPAPA